MNFIKLIFISFLSIFLAASGMQAQRKVLAVSAVKINDAIVIDARESKSTNSLKRVAQAIDGQFINALNGTRKFEIIARSDLDSLMEEGGFTGSGLQVKGSDYIIVPTIDDFQDVLERATFKGIGKTAEKRKIRLGMVARIYDANKGNLVEATNFQLDNNFAEQLFQNASRSGSFSDTMLRQIAEEMSDKMANRVVDVIYPARVVSLIGNQATINRGDGTGIAIGQVWEIFALGEEMIDPDTGESLGSSEFSVGKIKIQRVNPNFTNALIIDDYGITKGSIARPSMTKVKL
ncbi:MAG: hypothetical protein ACPGRH_08655 [Alphaproteobacteria bacterium]